MRITHVCGYIFGEKPIFNYGPHGKNKYMYKHVTSNYWHVGPFSTVEGLCVTTHCNCLGKMMFLNGVTSLGLVEKEKVNVKKCSVHFILIVAG